MKWLTDLRKPDGSTYDVEAIRKRGSGYAVPLIVLGLLVVCGSIVGGVAGMFWALAKYGGGL